MAYFRGPLYVWTDGTYVHLWNAEGFDSWDDSVWAEQYNGEKLSRSELDPSPSGVQIAQDQMDAYVVMRFAELIESGSVDGAVARGMEQVGNGGAQALRALASEITSAFPSSATGDIQ